MNCMMMKEIKSYLDMSSSLLIFEYSILFTFFGGFDLLDGVEVVVDVGG